MTGWTDHSGIAAVLNRDSIDTDQLIPARFMSTPRSEGYGRFLLYDLRFDSGGKAVDDVALNRVPGMSVLIAGRNFGSGSSREAAVYALVDFGIRVVVAPSFGDIFAANAVNNGLLPAQITGDAHLALVAAISQTGTPVSISLAETTLQTAAGTWPFMLDPVWREKLINGWDDIDLTRRHGMAIADHRARRAQNQTWAIPQREAAR